VEEETRARITANDSNADAPSMGGPSQSNGPEHGNSDITEVAQSDASPGRTDRAAGETGSDVEKETRAAAAAQRSSSTPEQPAIVARGQQQVPGRQGQEAREATQASESQDARPEVMSTPGGSYDVAHAREAQKHAQAQQARQALAGLDRRTPRPVLGLGSAGTTQNGINLNLSFSAAHAIVGADEISMMRKRDGERRLSQHRGSWTSMGLERWKPALENYVASVKPGNQTALNTAHSPFARYLNQIHQRLHEVFAYRFLGHLDKLPANHPLNNMDINTHLEIALSREDGRIVRMGVTKSSGVTAFDVGALDSVEKAAPYGPPPSSIVSPDGNVYLHWEFHRKPIYACSTYNAHPYILNADQKSAPPRVAPPKQPDYEKTPEKKPAQRSGSRSAPTPKLRPVSPT
jgi:outer membrane biosynthesis protein TonB